MPPHEELGAVQQEVGNGDPASASQGAFAPSLNIKGINARACTGILISPAWVLTANHCIRGANQDCAPVGDATPDNADLSGVDVDVIFDEDLGATPAAFAFEHTALRSGPIPTRMNGPTDSCSTLDSARDLALVQLNTRVPNSLVTPLHVPLAGIPPCSALSDPDDFTATMYGFGGTDIFFGAADPAVRTFNTSADWERNDLGGGEAVFENYWIQPGPLTPPTFWYDGGLPGDSGGPLVLASESVLCGVNSRFYARFVDELIEVPPFVVTLPAVGNDVADVASANNLAFLSAHILDGKGRFWGECDEGPVELRDVDSDDDLIPDACDVCPNAPARDAAGRNNYDLSGGGDSDGDLIPDACDNCPLAGNAAQADADGDGLGNACDSCPSSNVTGIGDLTCCATDFDCPGLLNVCVLGPGSAGSGEDCESRCAQAIDTDWDQVGQGCDNCPSLFNNQVDKDADGVGDACDNCPGTALGPQPADANPECGASPLPDAFCQTLHPEGECTPLAAIGGGVEPRRCTHFAADDDDNVGDGCDSCPGLFNPAWSAGQLQPNCNLLAEKITGMQDYPFTGDVCDPIPCAELDVTIPEPILLCPQGGCTDPFEPTVIPEAIRAVRFSPNLLPPGNPGAFANTGVPAATAGLRWCMCTQPSGPAEDCGCPVSAAQYESSGVWHVPLTYLGGYGTEFPIDPADIVPPEFSGLEMVDPRIVPIPASGFAPRDTNTFKANWIPEVVGPQRLSLWSNVVAVPQIPNLPGDYRPTASHYHVGYFGTPIDFNVGQNEIAIGIAPPFDSPVCLNCPQLIDEPNWVVNPTQQRLFAASLGRAEEMTGVLTADVRAAVVDLGPSPGSRRRSRAVGSASSICVPRLSTRARGRSWSVWLHVVSCSLT